MPIDKVALLDQEVLNYFGRKLLELARILQLPYRMGRVGMKRLPMTSEADFKRRREDFKRRREDFKRQWKDFKRRREDFKRRWKDFKRRWEDFNHRQEDFKR